MLNREQLEDWIVGVRQETKAQLQVLDAEYKRLCKLHAKLSRKLASCASLEACASVEAQLTVIEAAYYACDDACDELRSIIDSCDVLYQNKRRRSGMLGKFFHAVKQVEQT